MRRSPSALLSPSRLLAGQLSALIFPSDLLHLQLCSGRIASMVQLWWQLIRLFAESAAGSAAV